MMSALTGARGDGTAYLLNLFVKNKADGHPEPKMAWVMKTR